jgi:hypothetical protein
VSGAEESQEESQNTEESQTVTLKYSDRCRTDLIAGNPYTLCVFVAGGVRQPGLSHGVGILTCDLTVTVPYSSYIDYAYVDYRTGYSSYSGVTLVYKLLQDEYNSTRTRANVWFAIANGGHTELSNGGGEEGTGTVTDDGLALSIDDVTFHKNVAYVSTYDSGNIAHAVSVKELNVKEKNKLVKHDAVVDVPSERSLVNMGGGKGVRCRAFAPAVEVLVEHAIRLSNCQMSPTQNYKVYMYSEDLTSQFSGRNDGSL